ncbi:MAG: FHA domain-containing protein [Eubacterium sp.]|nr:FHA domain-containing protein [Eubacterium sp.]
MAKNNMEIVYQIEDMIKKYNKKPEKKIRKKDIVDMLQKADIILAMRTGFDEAEIFGEIIEGVSLKPDIVKDGGRARLLPVFTSYEQIPRDYMDSFSFIKVPASYAYTFMNDCDDLNGMVLNPFTEYNLELRKKRTAPKAQVSATKHYKKDVADNEPEAMIIYNNKKYPIKKTPFTIGRENASIDIPETYISKIHVVISCKDGKYRIADYDSTNGTRINGTQLRPKVYYELRDGYRIELAEKEEMVVYIN